MSLFGCLRSGCYFRFSTAGAAAFGLANALDTVPGGGASFFLSALGFLASRLVLFWPFAITVLPSEGCREPYVGPLSAGRQPGLADLVPGRLADGPHANGISAASSVACQIAVANLTDRLAAAPTMARPAAYRNTGRRTS